MSTTVSRVDVLLNVDGTGMPRQVERLSRKLGDTAGKNMGEAWNDGLEKELSDFGNIRLDAMRQRFMREGRESGRVFGLSLREAMASNITGWLDTIVSDIGKVFTFDGDEGFQRWASGFDSVSDASERMSKNINIALAEGRLQEETAEALSVRLEEYVERARDVEEADARQTESKRRLTAQMKELDITLNSSGAWKRYVEDVGSAEEANERLFDKIRMLNLVGADQAWADKMRVRLMDLNEQAEKAATSAEKVGFRYRDIPHNGRQAIVWTAAIIAGMESIAVLGSAAGAGLVALGGAATSGLIGVGGLAAVFVTLSKEIEDLPPEMQGVAREFRSFGTVFGQLREIIGASAFREMPGVFSTLRGSVASLSPEMAGLGTSTGKLLRAFAEGTRPGTEALEEIRTSIQLAGPNMESLAASTGLFGTALLRSFNRAQPLVEDLLGYLDTLFSRFDSFSQSNGFDQWISNAQTTFGALGGLLDAVGRGLNDLVTPDSVARTAAFLGNLERFTPHLTKFLGIMGQLDLFGLIALGLAEFGEAMEPLAEPMGELATEVRELAGDYLPAMADFLGVAAAAASPLVSALGKLLALVNDLGGGQGLALLVGTLIAFKAASNISAALTSFGLLEKRLTGATTAAGKLQSGLVGIGKGVGFAAALGVGVSMLDRLVNTANRAAPGIDSVARALSNGNLDGAFRNASQGADSLAESLNLVAGNGFDPFMERAGEFLGGLVGITGEVTHARDGITAMDGALANLVASGQMDLAAERFALVKDAAASQGIEVSTLSALYPEYQNALDAAKTSAEASAAGIDTVTAAAGLSAEQIQNLADKIRNFGNDSLTARSAAREYEAAIDTLTDSIATNGATLDITTEAGRQNEAALDALAAATIASAAETVELTGDQAAANGVLNAGRDQIVRMAQELGMTEQAANDYANELGLIPDDVRTRATLLGVETAEAALNLMARNRTTTITVNRRIGTDAVGDGSGAGGRGYASGGVVSGAAYRLTGEDGDEAIVPLNRPLSQVSPDVRELSAFAQGKAMGGGMSGGGGGQKIVNFHPGSLVVSGVSDPREAMNIFMTEIAEYVNG